LRVIAVRRRKGVSDFKKREKEKTTRKKNKTFVVGVFNAL